MTDKLPKVDPLLRRTPSDANLSIIRGYVDAADDETIRILPFRDRTIAISLATADMIDYNDSEDAGGRCTIYVREDAELRMEISACQTMTAGDAALASLRARRSRVVSAAAQRSGCSCSGEGDGTAALRADNDDWLDDFLEENACKMRCDGGYLGCIDDGLLSPGFCKVIWGFCYDNCRRKPIFDSVFSPE
jgi:hypothetical protein